MTLALLALAGVTFGACTDATTAPNVARTQIAYTAIVGGFGVTHLMNVDGSNQRSVASGTFDDEAPVLSPDGVHIAVTSDYTGQPQVYVMRTDGSGRIPITNLPAGALLASWTPDGKRLLFNSNDAHTYMVNADGTGLRLVSEDTMDEQLPVLSPDGRRIAFSTARNSTPDTLVIELYVMNADASHVVRLTTTRGFSHAVNMFPAWSPDGRRLAFVRALDDQPPHVWIVNADGTGLRQLFTGVDAEHSVAWSPDGRQLAFARRVRGAGRFDIYASNADGTNVRNLTNTPDYDEVFPNWGKLP